MEQEKDSAVSSRDKADFVEYIEKRGIEHIIIVSPHLDDAAFSASGLLLSGIAALCSVVTVFTEGSTTSDDSWALAGGFPNAMQEHAARRLEDRVAMNRMKVQFLHLGFAPDEFSANAAERAAELVLRFGTGGLSSDSSARTLCLLPAGAGVASRKMRYWFSLMRRIKGTPRGYPAHPEHLIVRDKFVMALAKHQCTVGFYGEFPYLWHDSSRALLRRLRKITGCSIRVYRLPVDRTLKLGVVDMYESQSEIVFGATMEKRVHALNRDEEYFLPLLRVVGT